MQKEILYIISISWERETCYPGLQAVWTDSNASLGQCAITSLVINDFYGGKIMRCMIDNISHYYNLINGQIVDLTVAQFENTIIKYENSKERTREYLLSNEDTKNRYAKLLINVKNNFIKYGSTNYKLMNEQGKQYMSKIPGTLGGNKKLKIYGKLDCQSALYWISKGKYIINRVFFEDEKTAIEAGYRPCAKCMKNEYKLWKQQNRL